MTSVICRRALMKAAGAIPLARLAKATAGMALPPEVALQPGKITYREGDPANISTTHSLVPGETAAGAIAETGCKMQNPSI